MISAGDHRMTTSDSSRHLERVRALLAKAESTEFVEEAAALSAKAYELIATHAIDLAMILGTGFAPFRGGPMRYAEEHDLLRPRRTPEADPIDFPDLNPNPVPTV